MYDYIQNLTVAEIRGEYNSPVTAADDMIRWARDRYGVQTDARRRDELIDEVLNFAYADRVEEAVDWFNSTSKADVLAWAREREIAWPSDELPENWADIVIRAHALGW